ncbi:hypothetical protein LPN04_01810 [Rugamonas sp. A1-17]|nr:hypothetical protein [Rugamonas sp. A1-17]
MERYEEAALRHYKCALLLKEANQLDEAGHLIGFAAECAIKHAIVSLRTTTDHTAPHGHFPTFLHIARKHITQRSSMFDILKNNKLLTGWDVSRRYHGNGTTSEEELNSWIQDAKRVLACARIRGGS